ncbi:MAG: PAS domain S-box protein [Burkholderiales bacterium]
MKTDSPEPAIPSDVLRKWQRIVDLLAAIVNVPSAVVCKLEPPDWTCYSIVANSTSQGNPFRMDETFSMDIGTFCETVIKSREPLLVANALEDDLWKSAPENKVGMISYLGFPVLWPDGRVFGTICVLDDKANGYTPAYRELLLHCRDVLQADLETLGRMSRSIEEQRAQLDELFARVPEAVVMVDRALRITRVNPAFVTTFGYTAEEAIGRRIKELIAPADLQDEVEGIMHRLTHAGDAFVVETVRKHKNGARIPVSLVVVPLSSNGGGSTGYLIYRDISETKRLESEQRRIHEIQLELAHATRISTLGLLSASIAHELNQPLTGIITNCATCLRMLSEDSLDLQGARDAVRRTMRDGDRASDMIARLRALFANKEPVSETVDLNEATEEVVALSRAELQKRQVTVRTEFAVDLPLVKADRVQLQQVVLNLLRNAADAMSAVSDRPRDVTVTTQHEAGGGVRLSVRDSGVGFHSGETDKLFETFYSTKDDGMGVGLSLCRSIIENHGGRLWADLNDGPGATFSFSVPCPADSPAVDRQEPRSSIATSST